MIDVEVLHHWFKLDEVLHVWLVNRTLSHLFLEINRLVIALRLCSLTLYFIVFGIEILSVAPRNKKDRLFSLFEDCYCAFMETYS